MKRFIICVISVIVLMALPARTFASPQDNTSSPLVELDGLKNRLSETHLRNYTRTLLLTRMIMSTHAF